MKNKIICPVCIGTNKKCVACKGKGSLDPPKPKNYKVDADGQLKRAATKLRKRGYTLREVAKILGYKGPQSIAHLLKSKK